jgi:hypothetical protein
MEQQEVAFDFKVPADFVRDFKLDPRIVVRHPWIIGIPAPELLVKPEILAKIKEAGLELMLVPKATLK